MKHRVGMPGLHRLNVKLIFIFLICFLLATATFVFYINRTTVWNDYNKKQNALEQVIKEAGSDLEQSQTRIDNKAGIERILAPYGRKNVDISVLLSDDNGNVLYTSEKSEWEKVDIQRILRWRLGLQDNQLDQIYRDDLVSINPLKVAGADVYLLMTTPFPEGGRLAQKSNANVFTGFGIAVCVFILAFFLLMRPIVRYIKEIETGVRKIATNNWQHVIRTKGTDELSSLAVNINRMANELREKFRKERELEQSKNELITNISHDLRTPLTSVIAYLTLLRDKQFKSEPEMLNYINTTYQTTLKLKQLIDELFEYTKLSSNDVRLDLQSVEFGSFLRQLVGEYIPILEKRDLRVLTKIPEEPIQITIDVEKMARVFDNLFSNAQKYSEQPSDIVVELSKPRKGAVVVAVTNQTDHINPEELTKLFEKFYRRDKSRSNEIPGSGIGLAVAQRIVELHRGKIWAESRGNLLTVYIELPLNNERENSQ